MAWAATPAMILGFMLSPMGAPMWMAVANRSGAMVIIWVTAYVVRRSALTATKRELALAEVQRRLQAVEHLAHDEQTGFSDWLREEISLELAIIDWRLNRFSHSSRHGFDLQTETLVLRRAVKRARHSVYGKELRLRDMAATLDRQSGAVARS